MSLVHDKKPSIVHKLMNAGYSECLKRHQMHSVFCFFSLNECIFS